MILSYDQNCVLSVGVGYLENVFCLDPARKQAADSV